MGKGNSNQPAGIRESRKATLLGLLAGWCMRGWSKTVRYEVDDRCGVTRPSYPLGPVIFALWHNRIFVIPPVWYYTGGKQRKSVILTSASKDGAIVARAMKVFGLDAVRGSSSRRAVAALIGLKRALQDGQDVCITPDGPRGPRYSFHPGVVKLAQATGAPIAPVHARFSSVWEIPSWDRLVIPKPFSKIVVTFDDLVFIPPKLDDSSFLAEVERVKAILLQGANENEPLL